MFLTALFSIKDARDCNFQLKIGTKIGSCISAMVSILMRMRACFFPDHSIKPFLKQLFLVVKKVSQLTLFAPKSIHKHNMGLCERFKKISSKLYIYTELQSTLLNIHGCLLIHLLQFQVDYKGLPKKKKQKRSKRRKKSRKPKKKSFRIFDPKTSQNTSLQVFDHRFKRQIDESPEFGTELRCQSTKDCQVSNFATKKVRFYLLCSAIINSVWNEVLLSLNHRCGSFFFRGGQTRPPRMLKFFQGVEGVRRG